MSHVNSWMKLNASDDELMLSEQLRNSDEFGGTDVGWVSQMRPFIREFSKAKDLVFDPFSGIGTTLIAAQLEGRNSWGCEIEKSRVELIKQRWRECGFNQAELKISEGSCVEVLNSAYQQKPLIDLCLTSVPYFGSSWQGKGEAGQLYAETDYDEYMVYIKRLLFILRQLMKPDAHLVLMAENIRNSDGTLLPIAWDIGKAMSKYFKVYDERIILYDKDSKTRKITAPFAPDLQTNRAHEYALIAKNTKGNITTEKAFGFLNQLDRDGFEFLVYGGFAALVRSEKECTTDLDLLLVNEINNKKRILMYLLNVGFDIFCENEFISKKLLSSDFSLFSERRFFRCLSSSSIGQVDLVFVDDSEMKSIQTLATSGNGRFIAKNNIWLNEQWRLE